ncbi:helix-turn-helix domain-containing protein [Streptomyces virginiae]|uniref:helix-turn-helix domain-containing protein n=1 Tax=Streptomyces virginiae TaxID=1961 RepID=UPI00371500C6
MGRPEKPVPDPEGAPGQLALGLRAALKTAEATEERAGRPLFTYVDLAAKAGFSRQTLQRAASGRGVPPLHVVVAYAKGCGVDPGPLKSLWQRARIAKERAKGGPRPASVPNVRQIRDEADLGAALRKLHVDSGSPGFREIEELTAGSAAVVRLPKTTAHLIISRQGLPRSKEQLRALLFVYGVSPARQTLWMSAWSRVMRKVEAERAKTRLERESMEAVISPATAAEILGEHYLVPGERFPGFAKRWRVGCLRCSSWSWNRLSALLAGEGGCRACRWRIIGDSALLEELTDKAYAARLWGKTTQRSVHRQHLGGIADVDTKVYLDPYPLDDEREQRLVTITDAQNRTYDTTTTPGSNDRVMRYRAIDALLDELFPKDMPR